MARKSSAVEPDHNIEILKYVSKMMNTTLFEAHCSCGWYLRGFSVEQAEELGKQHTDEPDVLYPSVIFDR